MLPLGINWKQTSTMKKQREQPVITEGRKVQKTVNVRGRVFNLTLHMNHYQYSAYAFELVGKVTNEAGEEVEGAWHWGTYGQVHREPLIFDTREGDNYLAFYTESSWANTRKRNGRKTLVDIVKKRPD